MIFMEKLLDIESLLKSSGIDYRIINNTIGKNLILLESNNQIDLKIVKLLKGS